MKRALLWAPLLAFVALLGVVVAGLWKPADRTVRSALVGKPLPAFALPALVPGRAGTVGAGTGRPRLVNIFGSWCIPCAAEAPQLLRLKAMGVRIDAVAVRDSGPAVSAFLVRFGDPYASIGNDARGAVQMALGSSGVPETFVVDASGIIVEQHVGDVRAEDVDTLARLVRGGR